jgi:hypothetical protein
MRSSCPICGGTLKPVLADEIVYILEGNETRALGKSQAYSCGSNGHIVIIPAKGNLISQTSEANSVSAAPERKQLLNSWKEIALYMGRGVRTVQRWEHELGLPIRRPRRKSRSSVIALATDLDEWLYRTPVSLGSNSKGNGSVLNSSQAGAPDETTASTAARFVLPPDKQQRPTRRSIV